MVGLEKHLGRILLAVIMVFGREVMRERARKAPAQVGFLAGSLRDVGCLALDSDCLFWVCLLSAVVPVLSFQLSAFLCLHSLQLLFDQSPQAVSL